MASSWKATPSEIARALLAIAAAAIATLATHAQQPAAAQQPEAQIAVRVELVNLDVTVTDARGNYVRNLKRENFRVLDEGLPQTITHFTPMEAPAQVLLVVETGPAVYLIHRQHLAAAHLLLQGLGPDDAVALATYDSQARLLQPFTTDKRTLQAQIAGLTYNLGRSQLNFYGSLAVALEWLTATPGKKSVVLLTTGLDDSPAARWEALLGKLRASEAAIYTVALGGELREPPAARKGAPADPEAAQVAERFAHADRVLKEIADITGGQAFFPRKPSDFDSIYRQIATVLRHTYRIGFAPPKRDGQFHRVFVHLLDDKGEVLGPFYPELNTEEKQEGNAKRKRGLFPKRVRYRLHTRRGYIAPH